MKPQEFFYTTERRFKEVSEIEFKDFINNYPRKLTSDCCGISEPPMISYNDFELANRCPYSMVARFDGGEPNDYYGWDYKRTYEICINYDECFQSKTGRFIGDEQDKIEEKEKSKFLETHKIKIENARIIDKSGNTVMILSEPCSIKSEYICQVDNGSSMK